MKTWSRKTLVTQLALAFGAAYGIGAGAAFAQALPAASVVSNASGQAEPVDAKGELKSIVVTAQRRPENKQSVPLSVTALTAEQLGDRNITDLSQMEGMSPGFTFGRSGTDARPAMRGVRTENVAVNGDTTIGYFVDGIYKSRAQQALASFVDIARVEIQRGPQGTLYGRNTFGGNVSVITAAPVLDKFQAAGSAQLGSFNKMRVEGMLNLPVNDTLAVRIAASGDKADGFVKNDFNPAADLFDQDLKYGRISVKLKPNDRFDATLRIDSTKQGGNGGSAFGYKQAGTYLDKSSCQQLFNASLYVMNVRPGNRDGVADCTRSTGAGAGTGANAAGSVVDLGVPLYKAGDMYHVDTDYKSFLKLTDQSASLDMAYRFDAFSVKSITGYADFNTERSSDSDMSASTIALDYQRTAAKTLSQEFQILSEGTGPLRYVAGYYYFKDNLRGTYINQQLPRTIRSASLSAPLSLAQNGAGFYDDPIAETESHALYAQLAYKATDKMTVTVGARRTIDRKDFRFANANSVLPKDASGLPDANRITFDTPAPPTSAFGTAGTSNCAPARGPGFYCDPANPAVLFGATYTQKEFVKSTGRIALDYQLAKSNLLYASYSTGFRSGGFNSGQALEAVRTFEPEEVKAIEIGSKNRFFSNTLQLNLAAFNNNYKNLQEQRQVPVGATTISTIFNAAKARANGVEAEFEWLPTENMSVGGTLSLLDAKYTSFPDAALPFGTSILVTDPSASATIVNGVTIAPAGQRRVFAPGYNCGLLNGTGGVGQPGAAFGCDLSGNRVPYAARFQGSVFMSYDVALPQGGKLTPMVVISFSDGYYGQPTNASIEKQGGFAKADLKLNWKISDIWSAQFFVDNATDKSTINRFVWGGGGALQVSAAPPRVYGVRVSYKSF